MVAGTLPGPNVLGDEQLGTENVALNQSTVEPGVIGTVKAITMNVDGLTTVVRA